MTQLIDRQQHFKVFKNIRIGILLLPLLTIFPTIHQTISESGSFIMLITLIVLTYLGHEFHFHNPSKQTHTSRYSLLQQARKIIVCFLSSYLTALLIAEVYYVVVNVYDVGFGDEIVFWFRVVVTLSNLQANMELCAKKHRKHSL